MWDRDNKKIVLENRLYKLEIKRGDGEKQKKVQG